MPKNAKKSKTAYNNIYKNFKRRTNGLIGLMIMSKQMHYKLLYQTAGR